MQLRRLIAFRLWGGSGCDGKADKMSTLLMLHGVGRGSPCCPSGGSSPRFRWFGRARSISTLRAYAPMMFRRRPYEPACANGDKGIVLPGARDGLQASSPKQLGKITADWTWTGPGQRSDKGSDSERQRLCAVLNGTTSADGPCRAGTTSARGMTGSSRLGKYCAIHGPHGGPRAMPLHAINSSHLTPEFMRRARLLERVVRPGRRISANWNMPRRKSQQDKDLAELPGWNSRRELNRRAAGSHPGV